MTARYHETLVNDYGIDAKLNCVRARAECRTCSYVGRTFDGPRAYRLASQDAEEHELAMMYADDQEGRP